jgi:antitoxin VapB
MIALTPETEALARGLARQQGITPEEAVKAAVERVAREAGIATASPATRDRKAIIAGIEAIANRCASRPVYDTRTPDEIIGYGENGVPQ